MPINPADFSSVIDNPNLPLTPGTTFIIKSDDGSETTRVEVTAKAKVIDGVTCVVVLDAVTANGQLVEKTFDYYAQHMDGSVWYFGEDVKNYENGVFVDTAGSWLAGVGGAEPGVIMKASPIIGETYSQENAPGIAEDMATVLDLDAKTKTTYASFDTALKTLEFTPLEPSAREHKFYAEGIGFVRANDLAIGKTEELVRIRFDGTKADDTIVGNIGRDVVHGHDGDDQIDGAAGTDKLVGGRGADEMTGGSGRDTFDFNALSELGKGAATRDSITDFTRGLDLIDLGAIDANTAESGNQAFDFIGADSFHGGRGSLRYEVSGSGLLVEGDLNGDRRADFRIDVDGLSKLGGDDFVL